MLNYAERFEREVLGQLLYPMEGQFKCLLFWRGVPVPVRQYPYQVQDDCYHLRIRVIYAEQMMVQQRQGKENGPWQEQREDLDTLFTAEKLVQLELVPLAAQVQLEPCITNNRYQKKIQKRISRKILTKIRKTVLKVIMNRKTCIF